jgi:diguanylate cyclase (GGDEF)-like protein
VLAQFVLVLVVLVNAVSVLAVLALFWRRGALARRPALSALAFAAFLYVLGYALELTGMSLAWKRYALAVQYLGIVGIPPLLLMSVERVARAPWLGRAGVRAVAWGLSAGAYLAVATSARHELFFVDLGLVQAGPLVMLDVRPGPVYVVFQSFMALSILTANVALFRAWRRAAPHDRGPMATLMAASLLPWVANLAYLGGWIPWRLDGPPFLLLPVALLFAWSVRNQGLVDLRPVARDQVVEAMRDPFLGVDPEGRIVDANGAGRRFLARLATEGTGADGHVGRYPALAPWTGRGGSDAEAGPHGSELQVDGRTLRVMPVDLSDRRGRPTGRALVFHDVTSYERLHRDLERLATTDALTGLPNRRRFFEVARRWLEGERAAGEGAAWLALDIDHFKRVNDRHGHEAGDRVLRAVAAEMLAQVRGGDLVARLGGEEFAVFLPGADETAAREAAERLRAGIAALVTPDRAGTIGVTVSVGVCALRGGRADLDAVLAAADEALYRAKREGRDRVAVAGPPRPGPRAGAVGPRS